MKFACAAKHWCKSQQSPVPDMHICRDCELPMHVHCAGDAVIPPRFDRDDQKEFVCTHCTGGIYLELLISPASSTKVTEEEEKGKRTNISSYNIIFVEHKKYF